MKSSIILAMLIATPLCHGTDQDKNLIENQDKENFRRSISVPLDLKLVNKDLVRVLKAELQNTTDTEEAANERAALQVERLMAIAKDPHHKYKRMNSCPTLPHRK